VQGGVTHSEDAGKRNVSRWFFVVCFVTSDSVDQEIQVLLQVLFQACCLLLLALHWLGNRLQEAKDWMGVKLYQLV
jgi:hypothetical protein